MQNIKYVSLLLTFIVGMHLASCEMHYIVPTQDDCSMSSCLTLSQFADNVATYIESSNITLFITGETHCLNKSMSVSNLSKFSLLSINVTGSSSVITCSEDASLTFSNIFSIMIGGLKFVGCSDNSFDLVNQLTIKHLIFEGRSKGGTSLIITNSTVSITDTSFKSNTGGTFKNVTIYRPQTVISHSLQSTRLSARVGGALIISSSDLTLDSCSFEDNTANIGGAIFSELESSINITNSTFTSNNAGDCDNGLCFGGVL